MISAPTKPYEDFTSAQVIRRAVNEPALRGDTYFMQFRGLHQIPETLGAEINDRLADAIADVRAGRLRHAIEQLGSARALAEVVDACLPPIVDSLATSDYHNIRENLGLTSGSHSICLRYELFTHLYQELWATIAPTLRTSSDEPSEQVELLGMLNAVARGRFDDPYLGDVHALLVHCIALRSFIFNWRAQHLHLPRNNLGGEETKSLTGSRDAVKTVENLRNAALDKDPVLRIAREWGLGPHRGAQPAVTAYIRSEEALDSHLLRATGLLTQGTFTDVQDRTGYFAQRSSFAPPRPREI